MYAERILVNYTSRIKVTVLSISIWIRIKIIRKSYYGSSIRFNLIVFRPVFKNPKSIQASVVLLDRMALILDKSSDEDARELILPLLFHSLESNMTQIQAREISDHILYFIPFFLAEFQFNCNHTLIHL